MDTKILKDLFQVTIELGNLCNRHDQIIHKRSSQEWKSGTAEHDRSGKPEEMSWDTLEKVNPHREEPLLGRNAHSARYGELIHDRTGQPVSVHYQEQAYSEIFRHGQ